MSAGRLRALVAAALIAGCCHSTESAHHTLGAARQTGNQGQDCTATYLSAGVLLPGADPTGTADSAPALRHWLAIAGETFCPCGTYRLKSTVSYGVSGASLRGSGYGCTVWKADDSAGNIGPIFESIDKRYGALTNGTISAYSARSSASYAVHVRGGDSSVPLVGTTISASQFRIDVDMDSQYSGVLIDDSTVGNWGTQIGSGDRLAVWRNFNTSGDAILWNSPKGASHIAQNLFITNEMTSLGHAGFRIWGTGDLQIRGSSVLGFCNGLLMDNTAATNAIGGPTLIVLSDDEFDNTGGASGCDNIRLVPGNVSAPIWINASNNWIATGYNGIYASGFNGTYSRAIFIGGEIAGAAAYGVRGTGGTTTTNIVIDPSVLMLINTSGNTLFN